MYAERIKNYLNQDAALECAGEADAYGQTAYGAPKPIKVRKEQKHKMVRDSQGNTVVSDTTVFCAVEVKPQDKIDGAYIIGVSDMVDRFGNVCGWEAYL